MAERTYVSRIECGRWASLPEEASRPRACLRLRTRGGSGPAPGGVSVPSPLRGPDSIWGPGPRGRSGTRLFWLSAPFSATRGVTGPFPSKEWVWGRLPGEKGFGQRGSGYSGCQRVVKDNYEALRLDTATPLGHVVTPDPSPSVKRVWDHWSGEMESNLIGPAAQLLRA